MKPPGITMTQLPDSFRVSRMRVSAIDRIFDTSESFPTSIHVLSVCCLNKHSNS